MATELILTAVAGCVVGAGVILAWHFSERSLRGTPTRTTEPAVNDDVATLLTVLRSSAVIVDGEDAVVKASAPAYRMGIVKGERLVQPELVEQVRAVRSDGQVREENLRLQRRGRSRYVEARVAPLTSRLTLVLADDRTREKRLENVRRDFVANVSHELKTPIGALKVLAEAMLEAKLDPEAVERFAHRMITESDRLAELVQQIIALSRLQADDPLESPATVSVDRVVDIAIDTNSVDATAKGIKLLHQGDHHLQTNGNPDQLASALSNLVANAVAYSNPDSKVVVRASAHDDDVDIEVIDEGIGIPPHELDRIFERFYRVDPARHRSTGGTGLGLSIVKHVAATHGGEVNVSSVEGRGSTFTLTLPRFIPTEEEELT